MRVGQQGHALRSCRQSCFRCPLERVSAVSCHPCRGNVPSACCWPVLEARLAAVRHNRERRRWPVQAQQSRQASSPSAVPLCRDPSLVAGFLEAGCIAAAASLQACILFRSIQQAQTQGQQPASRNTTYLPEQPSYSPTQPTTMLLHSGSAIAVVLALVLNFISRLKWTQRSPLSSESLTALAAARLARLEVVADRQAQAAEAAQRQISKLQIRTRIQGRDVQAPLRNVQTENMQQAEILTKLAARVEQLNTDVRDTQRLLSALEGVTGKQLQLVLRALQLAQEAKASSDPR